MIYCKIEILFYVKPYNNTPVHYNMSELNPIENTSYDEDELAASIYALRPRQECEAPTKSEPVPKIQISPVAVPPSKLPRMPEWVPYCAPEPRIKTNHWFVSKIGDRGELFSAIHDFLDNYRKPCKYTKNCLAPHFTIMAPYNAFIRIYSTFNSDTLVKGLIVEIELYEGGYNLPFLDIYDELRKRLQ